MTSCATLLLLAAELLASCSPSYTGSAPTPPTEPIDPAHGTVQSLHELPGSSERWALVVGIGKYDDPYVHPLYGDTDATAFATVLEERAGFRNDHIILLAGQHTKDCRPVRSGDASESASTMDPADQSCQPTRTNFWQKLYQLTHQIPSNGLFVLFFSGHGKYVAGESVLFPSDLKYKNEDNYLKAQGVSARDLADAIRASKIKQVLIFLDACRDQLLAKKGAQQDETSPQFKKGFDLDALNADVEAFMTFFSSGEGSASYEDPGEKMSYFTSELVHAFDGQGDAYDARNLLTLGGLIRSVQTKVRERVEKDRRGHQLPDFQLRGYLPLDLALAVRGNP
jgi:uncharacterized caspase-like protein